MPKERSDKRLAGIEPGSPRAVQLVAWVKTPGLKWDDVKALVETEWGIKTSRTAVVRKFDEIDQHDQFERRKQEIRASGFQGRAAVEAVREAGITDEQLEADLKAAIMEARAGQGSLETIQQLVAMWSTIVSRIADKAKVAVNQDAIAHEKTKWAAAQQKKIDAGLDELAREADQDPETLALLQKVRERIAAKMQQEAA
jgi:hypothetical protein